jgi:hypothetical protein
VLRGEVGVKERDSSGAISGYVGGSIVWREKCADVSWVFRNGCYENQVCPCQV